MLDRLKRADGLPELFAGLGIVDSHAGRALGNAGQIGRDQQRGAIGNGTPRRQVVRHGHAGKCHGFVHASRDMPFAQGTAGHKHRTLRAEQHNLLRLAAVNQVRGAIAETVGKDRPRGSGNQCGAQSCVGGEMRGRQLGEHSGRGKRKAKRPRDERFLAKPQSQPAEMLGAPETEQAKSRQFLPHGALGSTAMILRIPQALYRQTVLQEIPHTILDHALIVAEGQVNDHLAASRALGPLGSPSMRSAMALRRISLVPPPMPHLKLSK